MLLLPLYSVYFLTDLNETLNTFNFKIFTVATIFLRVGSRGKNCSFSPKKIVLLYQPEPNLVEHMTNILDVPLSLWE